MTINRLFHISSANDQGTEVNAEQTTQILQSMREAEDRYNVTGKEALISSNPNEQNVVIRDGAGHTEKYKAV